MLSFPYLALATHRSVASRYNGPMENNRKKPSSVSDGSLENKTPPPRTRLEIPSLPGGNPRAAYNRSGLARAPFACLRSFPCVAVRGATSVRLESHDHIIHHHFRR